MTLVIRSITPDKVSSSNLHLWLKAESLSGYSNGSNITSWNDSSSNGYNFTNSSNYPTCKTSFISGGNGLNYNVAQFSNSSFTYLTANNSACGNFYNNFTLIAAIYQTSPMSSPAVWMDKGGANVNVNGWYCSGNQMVLNNSGNDSLLRAGYNQALINNSGVSGVTWYLNNWKIMSFIVQSNGAGQGWMNGIPGPATSSFTVTSNTVSLQLGNYGASGANLGGYIAEVILYNTALTDFQRRDVENYLQLKFQI